MAEAITFGAIVREWSFGDCVATETLHPPHLRLPVHDHEPANLTIVLSGGFEEAVGRTSIACAPGTALLKPAGAHHSNAYGPRPVHCLTVSFANESPCEVVAQQSPSFRVEAHRLLTQLRRGEEDWDFIAQSLAVDLLSVIACAEKRCDRARPRWIDVVEDRLHCDDQVSIAALARMVGRHPSHMAREYRRHTGRTLGQAFRDARFARVCEALLQSTGSIADVAAGSGFADQSHLTNAFRRRFGITPAQFRAQDSFKTAALRRN